MIIAGTGHRPNKLGGYRVPNPTFNSVMEGMDKILLELRPDAVICGMALGVDQWLAELCIFNGIPYIAAIPFQGFDSRWPEPSRVKYRQLLDAASRVEVVCTGGYEPWKMQRRNEWMVDNCDRLLAVFDGTDGGTANCVRYARNCGKSILYVPYNVPPVAEAPVERQRVIEIRPAQEVLRELPVQERRIHSPRSEVTTEGTRRARQRAREAREADEARERRQLEVNIQQFMERLGGGVVGETVETATSTIQEEVSQLLEQGVFDDPEEVSSRTFRRVLNRARRAMQQQEIAESEKKKEEPLVREFGRIVDLD